MLTADHFAAIGRVAVAAASLETQVCTLLVLASGNKGDVDHLLTRPNGQVRDELRSASESLPDQLRSQITSWLDRCDYALPGRHELMHARWGMTVQDTSGNWVPIGIHTRRGPSKGEFESTLIPAVADEWSKLATRLDLLRHESEPLIYETGVACGLLDDADHLRTEDGS